MSEMFSVIKNDLYEGYCDPFFTIITPVFNRAHSIGRTIDSVKAQTFNDFEYILVDDGSKDNIDEIVWPLAKLFPKPFLYIKKENGGVHTARNVGYRYARGKFIVCIDSDDELLPTALSTFFNEWNKIPEQEKPLYWQIKAQCVDVDGNITGTLFPEDVNSKTISERLRYFSSAKGEQIGCRVASLLKENLFPEPEGVKFVNENILWIAFEKRYLSWGTNEVVRIYHKEGEDHLSNTRKKKSLQALKDIFWNKTFLLNNDNIYKSGVLLRIKNVFKRTVIYHLIVKKARGFVKANALTGGFNKVVTVLFFIPTAIIAKIIRKKKTEL